MASLGASLLHRDAAFELAQSDPVAAAKAFARGLRHQSRGGRLAAVRMLVDALIERDPAIAPDLQAILARRQP